MLKRNFRQELFIICITASLIKAMTAQPNLIKDGDFENYTLIYQIYLHVGNISSFSYDDSWYRPSRPGQIPEFQVLNYLNTTTLKGLDTVFINYPITQTCQDVELEINKTYRLQFQYLIDYPAAKRFNATFNNETIISEDVNSMIPILFQKIIKAQTTTGTLCFIGFYDRDRQLPKLGVVIDNVYLGEAIVTQAIAFDVIEDWETEKLMLSSNFVIDPLKIMMFSRTLVTIGGVKSSIISLSLGEQRNLQLVTDLKILLNQSSLEISVFIPDYDYTDSAGYGVKFIVQNTSNLTLKEMPISNQLEYLASLFSIFFKIAMTIELIGFAVMVFRFISFANIFIMYIFLDVGYLNLQIRQSLEILAKMSLGQGLIASFSEIAFDQKVDLTFFKVETIEKMPEYYSTNGSSLQIINISSNLFESCFDDLVVMVSHCILILIIWLIISELQKHKKFQQRLKDLSSTDFINLLLIQVLSVAPIWVLSITVTLTQIAEFGSQSFLTKISQGIFLLLPIMLVLFWVPHFLNYFATIFIVNVEKTQSESVKSKKKVEIYKKKEFKDQRENQQIKQDRRFQNKKHLNKTEGLQVQNYNKEKEKKGQFKKEQNIGQRKKTNVLPKKKKKYIYSNIQRIEPLNTLFYVLFGFFIGFQNLYFFFTIVTFYLILVAFLLSKRCKFSFQYVVSLIEVLIKLIFHLSYLSLFILSKLVEYKKIENEGGDTVKQWSDISSKLIFYSFLSGVCLDILIFIANFMAKTVYFIKILVQIANKKKIHPKNLTKKDEQRQVSEQKDQNYELIYVQQVDNQYIFQQKQKTSYHV